jgi:Holliday junction resolvasome RuvABC endonuclease subunit
MTTATLQPATGRTSIGPTVIGIDTSITGTGLASSRGWTETVGYTNKKAPFTKLPHPQRLTAMRQLLADILQQVGEPALAVLETPAPSRTGGGAHERAWLWWEVYRALTNREIPVGLVSTNQRMLYATGKGQADKTKIVDAVARRWPDWSTDGDDNRADAVVLMAAGRDWLGHPVCPMPKPNRVAVERAVWPEQVTQ